MKVPRAKPIGRRARNAALGAAGAVLGWRLLKSRRAIHLAGRVALVTGGSRGLGLLLAREFARRGARVAICARSEAALAAAERDLEARGADVHAVVCDVADRQEVDRLVASVYDRFGEIDILVNNAGIIQVGPMECLEYVDYERALTTNFWGAVHCTLAVLPRMRARRSGRIVNITSIGAKVAIPHLLPYSASKFALRGFSEGLHAEAAKDGIVVTTVVPGLMRTGSPVNAIFKGRKALEYTWFSLGDATPLTAMDAERAAARIVEATRRGESEVTLTWQARLLGLIHDLAPGATQEFLGVVNRLLPGPHGRPDESARGMELATPLSPSPVTALMNRAARAYNQFGGARRPVPEHARRIGLEH